LQEPVAVIDAVDGSILQAPLGGQSLHTDVRKRLHQAIAQGNVKAGEQIVEPLLARHLSISQAHPRGVARAGAFMSGRQSGHSCAK